MAQPRAGARAGSVRGTCARDRELRLPDRQQQRARDRARRAVAGARVRGAARVWASIRGGEGAGEPGAGDPHVRAARGHLRRQSAGGCGAAGAVRGGAAAGAGAIFRNTAFDSACGRGLPRHHRHGGAGLHVRGHGRSAACARGDAAAADAAVVDPLHRRRRAGGACDDGRRQLVRAGTVAADRLRHTVRGAHLPGRSLRAGRMNRYLVAAAAAVALMLVAAAFIFFFAPTDALQGPVQRIFYLHVSSAIAAFVSFAVVVVGSVAYLWRESIVGDRVARSAALVGVVFATVTLVMGMMWAKPIWGTFWTWDARLTSTLVLWIIYAGYLLVRRLAAPGRQAARFAAVVGIFGFVDVPVVHFSVTWWRTIHPGPVVINDALPPAMLATFFFTMAATLFLAAAMIAIRYRIEVLTDQAAERNVSAAVAAPSKLGTTR